MVEGVGLAVGLLACLAPAQHPGHAVADVVYHSANIYTVDDDRPRAEAFAVADGEFVLVGSNEEVLGLVGEGTEVFDAGGRTIVPGLIDAHGHVLGLGQLRTGVVDLSGTESYDEVIERVVARAVGKEAGSWIIGRGWDHESWSSRELPLHDALTAALPDYPVYLERVDGHAGLANSLAMELAGVDSETESPSGGEIIRGADGSPTGVFVDNAESLVRRAIPVLATPSPRETALAAQRMCFEEGVTGVHDMGTPGAVIGLFREMVDRGELSLRINCYLPAMQAGRWFDRAEPEYGDTLSVAGCKLYIDGAMGSRGAWLLEPYADRPLNDDGEPYTGLAVMDMATVRTILGHAESKGYQVAAHAIGDRANRELLDAYGQIFHGLGAKDRRWRVEHAQLLDGLDLQKFARFGVIASMQPTHCTSDMRWIEDRVGEDRAAGAYAWASLLRTGAVIASGSDFPVEGHDPMLGFYAAVTRQDASGMPEGGWRGEERMTRWEALRSMTLDAAYAGFREERVGSIEVGKLADFVVFDTDIMTCEPREILEAEVVRTVVGGRVVYAE